ncbi:MAG: S41 family peptidase [Prevotellaceae bacterium]|jgi:carboxyl-terminal processing protease|nr:S41 family peptidase [Prevotellaceae bacterium]
MEKRSKKELMRTLLTIAILLLGLFLGFRIGRMNTPHVLIPPKSNKLDVILDFAQKNYVDSISMPDLIEKAIPEVLKHLDPHSVYISASDMKGANEQLEGNFEGIGVTFNMPEDTIVVMGVISGGPSERVGVQMGDRIVKIDDSIVAGKKIPQDSIVKRLRGKSGTEVSIEVKRIGIDQLIPFNIIRGKIPIKSVDVAYMVNDEIGYIKMSKFARTTHQEFVDASKKLHKQGMKKFIVDLRDNSGGYLDQAFEIANEFLPKGQMIVYTEGRVRARNDYRSTGSGRNINDDVVVIINETSASASEILAGAIQDNDRGTIVGRRSFGKGLVQEPHMFKDGSGFRLTIARYYTPTGRSIQRPYTEGLDDYYMDIVRRYQHGEFEVADSIHHNDSLRYETPGGKIVYGGGGIMPDVFVPIDTTRIAPYLSQLIGKNLIYKFALNYSDRHRMELNGINDLKEFKAYFAKRNLFGEFLSYASRYGISPKGDDLEESKKIIMAQLQAYIGRNTPLDDEGFYPFFAEIDNTVQAAIAAAEEL